jgi:hypothetical protein
MTVLFFFEALGSAGIPSGKTLAIHAAVSKKPAMLAA